MVVGGTNDGFSFADALLRLWVRHKVPIQLGPTGIGVEESEVEKFLVDTSGFEEEHVRLQRPPNVIQPAVWPLVRSLP